MCRQHRPFWSPAGHSRTRLSFMPISCSALPAASPAAELPGIASPYPNRLGPPNSAWKAASGRGTHSGRAYRFASAICCSR
ncbi:hypothetical protein WJX72_006799 [[Myrmecia] bisecta]|uniref:Uncharacterized protein n=1 Tax=[Myrmecia] bisecta TaxID=41462 RepID=A0AAW1PY37_9CHLO